MWSLAIFASVDLRFHLYLKRSRSFQRLLISTFCCFSNHTRAPWAPLMAPWVRLGSLFDHPLITRGAPCSFLGGAPGALQRCPRGPWGRRRDAAVFFSNPLDTVLISFAPPGPSHGLIIATPNGSAAQAVRVHNQTPYVCQSAAP